MNLIFDSQYFSFAVDTPDRIQADLMGHKFHRPKYGDGASLNHKLEWMKRIQLKSSTT